MKVAIRPNYKIPKLENRVINLPIFKLNPIFIALFLIAESISVSKQNQKPFQFYKSLDKSKKVKH